MKHPFFGGILLALPLSLLTLTACGDESVINSNDVKQVSEDDESESDDPDTPVSSEKQSSKSSSSSAKSSEKSSSSRVEESAESDIVETEDDLPKCSIKREGKEIYVKEEKNLYTCEEGEWIPEKKTVESSSSTKKSSSSGVDIASPSSSSVVYIDVDFSSSSKKDELVPITGLGMCAPVTTPIDKGSSAKWKFTPNMSSGYTAIDIAKATYAWNFGAGATPATDATPSTSVAVSYANSGKASASLTVTMSDGSTETIQCSPLQVNGDPITGCKCTTEATSVDYMTTPDVTWSVTGCTSASTPLTYNWNGTEGGVTFTNSFTAATASYAPTLKVGNADNTVIDVACPAVKVTEGVEYVIKNNTDAGKISLPGEGTYNVVIAFACMNRTFFCNGVSGPVGGSVNSTPMKKDWYTVVSLSPEDCSGSAVVSVTVDGPATCGAQ
ncbi:hypothetical protein [Fibrobacter sp.]|uniref:hypothetical protein n=1 Tax=Fibrobacter sp. TaxID=35828 RepID=UPI0038648F64